MIRFLVVLFVSGLLVCVASFSVAAALGFPEGLKNFNFGPHMSWDSDDNGERGPDIGPPGPQGTRQLAWDGDEDLTINVPGEVTYTQGPDAKVVVTGPRNWIDRIRVEDGDISLDRGHYSWKGGNGGRDNTIHIQVTAPHVKTFELNGAQDMKILAFNQDNLELQVNGAARVRAQGQARTMRVELNGASKAELADLANDEADVELNGAASIVLAPKLASDIEINGVGSAKVLTRPEKQRQQIHGFGTVRYGVDRSETDNDEGRSKSELVAPPAAPTPPAPPARPVAPKAKAA